MTQNPVYIPPTLNIQHAAQVMRDKKLGSLLVYDTELRGIIVRADIIKTVVAEAKNPTETTVEEIMTEGLVTIHPDTDILDALELMGEHDIRTLPVMHKNELVGFITAKDILKINPELFELLADNIVLREEQRKTAKNPFEPRSV